ncbi:MAG TPA: ATP-binding protein [Crocinitomicaceae bacterium]|nr:ATP-binding protein [Crocinitomicaceae bacterium]
MATAEFIPRMQQPLIEEKIKSSKLVLIQGPRKVGKRTLVENILKAKNNAYSFFNCSDKKVQKTLAVTENFKKVKDDFIVLYEAQYLANLGAVLEAVLMSEISSTVIIICSYKPQIDEVLLEAIQQADLEVNFFAPSFYETAQHFGLPNEEKLLEERLIYGSYPNVLADLEFAEVSLREIIDEAIFTNLRAGERINKGKKLMRMLQLLAFNVGHAVSYNDISERCGLDNETVERYIDLLEDAFILIRLKPFFNNKRYELKKTNMIYFADNGVRNVLISNFNPTFLRNDMNELWRNYVIAERIKWLCMRGIKNELFFWKTHTKQQMDFIEIKENKIFAYKTDWEKRKKLKFSKSFSDAYPEAKVSALNRSTYWSFLTNKK